MANFPSTYIDVLRSLYSLGHFEETNLGDKVFLITNQKVYRIWRNEGSLVC